MDEEATATGRIHGEQPMDELMKRWHLTNPQDVWDIFFLADAEAIKKEAREA